METQTNDVQTSTSKPNSSKNIIIIVVVIVLIGIGWFFSRGGVVGVISPEGVDIDRNLDGSATYTTEQGSVTVGGNSYPDNWPTDAPKYSGAKIQYSGSSNPQTGEVGSALVFTTSDSVQKVVDFYKKELTSNGWTIEQTMTIGQMTIVAGKKGNKTFGAQIVGTDDGQTAVTVGIGN